MPRVFYNEIFNGREDENILKIIENCNSDEKRRKIIKILSEVIENDLTPKQREALTEYFFNNKKCRKLTKNREFPPLTYRRRLVPESGVYTI